MYSKTNNRTAFLAGVRVGIPISLGYFSVAFALGITAKEAGLNAFQAGVMSLGMLASAGEFAAVTLISSGAAALEMITTTIIVNMRYLLMGCSLSQKLGSNVPLVHRFLVSYCITDEIFGVCVSLDGTLNPFYAYGAAAIAAPGWTLGTVLGLLTGNILPVWAVNSLSVALYGMFLAVIIPASRKSVFIRILVLVSMCVSYIFTKAPVLKLIPAGYRIIILTLLIAGTAALIRPVDEKEEGAAS